MTKTYHVTTFSMSGGCVPSDWTSCLSPQYMSWDSYYKGHGKLIPSCPPPWLHHLDKTWCSLSFSKGGSLWWYLRISEFMRKPLKDLSHMARQPCPCVPYGYLYPCISWFYPLIFISVWPCNPHSNFHHILTLLFIWNRMEY